MHSLTIARLFALTLFVATASAFAQDTALVIVRDYGFEPPELTIRPGTRVRWENQEKRQYHSVFFEQLGDKPGDYFFPGESRERVFDKPGTYPYICEPHWESHGMKGVIHVVQ